MHQRQEQSGATISGRKINNYFTCTVREVKRLSPHLYEQQGPEKTYQTDSFKQILTKRSAGPANKENVSTQNKALKKIKEQPTNKQTSQDKKKSKSGSKRPLKKSSAVSLTKLFQRNASTHEQRKKQTKSVSPSKDIKDYRSGPVQKKNYLSNNISNKTKQVAPSRSEKSLTERVKNSSKTFLNFNKKQDKKQAKADKKDFQKTKKQKISGKSQNQSKKQGIAFEKTESIAKQFDCLLKNGKKKEKKSNKKKISKEKVKKSKSKDKKIVVSHNTSKNFLEKQKLNSNFSQDSPESPQRTILSTRYQCQKEKSHRQRLSFEPSKKKGKSKEKAKTEALSPEKSLVNKNEAATTIQKVFRGFLVRKYIKEFKRILVAVITIQKMWRGHRARKVVKAMKSLQTKRKKDELKLSKISMVSQLDKKIAAPHELASLLEEILNEQNINEAIKSKINNFLRKEQRVNSSRSSSVISHMEQQMRSEKRYLEQMDRKKFRFGSPTIQFSPKLQRQSLRKSPEMVIDNLMAIKQFQRQKLIHNARLQIEGLENLALRNIFSPRTRDVKKVEIRKKLEEDLSKFDENISQVIKTCKQSDDIVGPIKPFSGGSTPQKNKEEAYLMEKDDHLQNSPNMKLKNIEEQGLEKINSSERKLQDLSMELLEYYEQKTQQKGEKQYEKIDPSYHFIEDYLLSLFQFLRQLGQDYRQKFIDMMRTSRNLEIECFLKNLNILTEDSDEDISFKLPMYKYLELQDTEVLEQRVSQEFNNSYKKLQRHQLGTRANIEEIYLKMIIDSVNEALKIQRPKHYIFTEASLIGKSNRMRIMELEALDGLDGDDNEPEFSFYFANSMNHIYKWAHFQCGRMASEEQPEQNSIEELNQMSMKQYLKFEVQKQQNYYDELLEAIVALSNCVFDEIVLQEGVNLFLSTFHEIHD